MPEPVRSMLGNGTDSAMDQFEIKTKVAFANDVMIVYLKPPLSLAEFFAEVRDVCHFDIRQEFTVKWVDEEGDPCTISSQTELDEAFRLYEVNRDSQLTVHVFPNVPLQPGLPCQGEDKHVYRRGARRWKKFYRVNGHLFQAKRLNKRAICVLCKGTVWGLGSQGFRCVNCKMFVHKKCHKMVRTHCTVNDTAGVDSLLLQPPFPGLIQNERTLVNGESETSIIGDKIHGGGGYVNRGLDDMTATNESPEKTSARSMQQRGGGGVVVREEIGGEETAVTPSQTRGVGLDDFNLLKVIGRGSYAKVLQVEYKRTAQVYAMKVIKKTMVTDEEDIDWVQTEKHVFEIASNHPFLVGLHSCFQTPSRLYFVIEFVPGGDLMFHMQRQRRLPEEHARFYSSEIILALQFLHYRGVIYRDLKLDNVLIDADGHIKLTDYGMCKEGIGPNDTTSTFCGTPNYIAPEILRGEEYSFSVDWWALGVLMYEMMAGRSPFDIVGMSDAPDQQTEDYLFQIILEKTIRIPRSLSVKAASVLKGFLNKNPQERLGCHASLEQGFNDIKNHPYFKSTEWDLLEAKQVAPPYNPPIRDERDLEHFDRQFTDEPVQFTPDDDNVIKGIDQSEFEGFEYVNPFLMTTSEAV